MMLIWILALGGGLWNMCDEQQAHFVPFKIYLKLTLFPPHSAPGSCKYSEQL